MMRKAILGALAWMFAVMPCLGAELDDEVNFGGFFPGMTLEEADRHAGGVGRRECKTWSPNPVVHWCRWTFTDDGQHVVIGYGPDGVIFDLERRVPLPVGMDDEEALAQAAEKLVKYGKPSRSVIEGNLHWGCKGDDCSGPRMVRVWIMEGHVGFFGGRRHMAMGWSNRLRANVNQQRFERESRRWEQARKGKSDGEVRERLKL